MQQISKIPKSETLQYGTVVSKRVMESVKNTWTCTGIFVPHDHIDSRNPAFNILAQVMVSNWPWVASFVV